MSDNLILNGADDPSTFSFQDTTPIQATGTTTPDPDKQFNADWDTAQQRYRAAVNSGYSEADAAQLYLNPVKDKWDILKDVPETMKRQAAAEMDQAQQAFVVGAQSGYKANDSENIYLKPTLAKWQAASKLPDSSSDSEEGLARQFLANPAMQKEQSDAYSAIANRENKQSVVEAHPTLLVTPGYKTNWRAIYNMGLRENDAASKEKQIADAKEAAAEDPEKVIFGTMDKAKKFSLTVPPQIQQAAQQLIDKTTNSPAIGAQPPVSFRPTAPAAQPATAMSPKDKVAMAQKISADHPDWTKQQVLMAVQKMSGAQ
jgi:hypothetical protein